MKLDSRQVIVRGFNWGEEVAKLTRNHWRVDRIEATLSTNGVVERCYYLTRPVLPEGKTEEDCEFVEEHLIEPVFDSAGRVASLLNHGYAVESTHQVTLERAVGLHYVLVRRSWRVKE